MLALRYKRCYQNCLTNYIKKKINQADTHYNSLGTGTGAYPYG